MNVLKNELVREIEGSEMFLVKIEICCGKCNQKNEVLLFVRFWQIEDEGYDCDTILFNSTSKHKESCKEIELSELTNGEVNADFVNGLFPDKKLKSITHKGIRALASFC